ncbi:11105_t:CDS:1 [Diversispora eburnea]|uniref:11105_t:CDS:1 n=1 Tax=Diversispora eburnea TaxID=1213867 RepID=A0A9N9FGR2_9GLOM|nr:11105_t:CDS:1 [Diversispora eburnea]
MEFQKLIEIIKKYKGNGIDYAYTSQTGGRSSPDNTRNHSYSKEVYNIYSPELKKEAREIALFGHTEDGGFCRFSTEFNGEQYEYEKGDGSNPDKLTIKGISPEEKRKQQEQRDREKAQQRENNQNDNSP